MLLLAAPLMVAAGCAEQAPPPPAAAAQLAPRRQPTELPPALPREVVQVERVAAYNPPYPEREDLFAPPKRTRAATRSNALDDDESVQLLGFVSVDQPKAVLSIDGVIASVAAGTAKHGIEVISIAPPEVVLQRGRNRWTASLD